MLTKQFTCCIIYKSLDKSDFVWEHSSAGRASALQAEGHRFEPCCSHHIFGLVVQLVRTLACHARGRGFDSHPGRQIIAREISGFAGIAHPVERHLAKVEVASSSLVARSIFYVYILICLCSSVGRAGD